MEILIVILLLVIGLISIRGIHNAGKIREQEHNIYRTSLKKTWRDH